MNEAKKPLLDKGGKSIVAVMAALLVAIFAFQLNASMLSCCAFDLACRLIASSRKLAFCSIQLIKSNAAICITVINVAQTHSG